jgi:hypothetical protein
MTCRRVHKLRFVAHSEFTLVEGWTLTEGIVKDVQVRTGVLE